MTGKSGWNTLGWFAWGTAAAASATAVYFAVETNQAKDDVVEGLNAAHFNWSRDSARLQQRQNDFFRDRALAYGFTALAALALGTGTYAWTLAALESPSSATAWSVTLSTGSLHAGYRVRF
jgi:hypothetical protein